MKKLVTVLLLFGVLANVVSVVYAEDIQQSSTVNVTVGNGTGIEPQGESTGYKYVTIDGVLYKRLWSYTRSCWIDKKWTIA